MAFIDKKNARCQRCQGTVPWQVQIRFAPTFGKNGYFLPLLLDFCTILFNPLNKNRGKLSNSLNNFSVDCKQILVWQGTVPLAGFTSRVFRRNLSQFHNVEQVEHYIIYLCMPTFMKMAIIPIVQRMILGV